MATTTSKESALKLVQKDTVDIVAERVRVFQEKGELHFPEGYSPENAMKAAWLVIQEAVDRNGKPAFEVCTRNSIANALLNMVVQGLNPIKKQCYFIVYGDQLQLQRSYFGSMHMAKTMDPNIDDIVAEVVYKGDTLRVKKERGRTIIDEHAQSIENIDKAQIIGAYCSIFYADGTERTTLMTFDEIKTSWKQSKMTPVLENGNIKGGTTHEKFTAEMCKKTVINRACKTIINSSNDSSLILKAYRETEADIAEAEAAEEIAENANKTQIIIDTVTGEATEYASEPEPSIPAAPAAFDEGDLP